MNMITFKGLANVEYEYEKSRISKAELTESYTLNVKGEHADKTPRYTLEINERGTIILHPVTKKTGINVLKQVYNIKEELPDDKNS